MNIKEKHIYLIASTLLLGLAFFFAFKSRNSYISLYKVKEDIILEKEKINDFNERTKLKLYMVDVQLKPFHLLNPSNDSVLINSLVKSPKLVLRFSDKFCSPCTEESLKSINIIGDAIGFNNILIISDLENTRLLNIFIDGNNVLSPCFSYQGKLDFEIENIPGYKRAPYYFVLDQNLMVSLPFFANEDNELNTIYIERIINMFNKINSGSMQTKTEL